MKIQQCDLCKKKIEEDEVNVYFPKYKHADFCIKCAQPVLKFLEKNKFINKREIKKV